MDKAAYEQDENPIGEPLKAQLAHGERTFTEVPDMFGTAPDYPALKAAALFREEKALKILELGGGQGRDAMPSSLPARVPDRSLF